MKPEFRSYKLEDMEVLEEQVWKDIPEEKKKLAIDFLQKELSGIKEDIKKEIEKDPKNWIAPFHFYWGMGIRNILRENDLGEKFFGIENLDYIYVQLIEEAVK